MTTKGYMNYFYKQFEKLNDNFEKTNQIISKISYELSMTRDKIRNLKKEIEILIQNYEERKFDLSKNIYKKRRN